MLSREKAEINVQRAGEFFMYSIWLQGQMSDLIILKKNSKIIPDFINNPSKVPKLMSSERAKYWEKQFHSVKKEFTELFTITNQHLADLEAIYTLRNAIAHSHVSMGRDYLLYRPARGEKQEQSIISTLSLSQVEDQSDPLMLKLSFYNEKEYLNDFSRIKRLDEECFESISISIGVPHSRVR
jgi:hypothetical protein